jgi:hypothetical protein
VKNVSECECMKRSIRVFSLFFVCFQWHIGIYCVKERKEKKKKKKEKKKRKNEEKNLVQLYSSILVSVARLVATEQLKTDL